MLDLGFCFGRLAGRHATFFETLFVLYSSRDHPPGNDACSTQDHQKSETGREVIAFEMAARMNKE